MPACRIWLLFCKGWRRVRLVSWDEPPMHSPPQLASQKIAPRLEAPASVDGNGSTPEGPILISLVWGLGTASSFACKNPLTFSPLGSAASDPPGIKEGIHSSSLHRPAINGWQKMGIEFKLLGACQLVDVGGGFLPFPQAKYSFEGLQQISVSGRLGIAHTEGCISVLFWGLIIITSPLLARCICWWMEGEECRLSFYFAPLGASWGRR